MAQFEPAFQKTMKFEGGYVNDPDDRGGETYRGISRKHHPDWPGWGILKKAEENRYNIERRISDDALQAAVREFYQAEFWAPLKSPPTSTSPNPRSA